MTTDPEIIKLFTDMSWAAVWGMATYFVLRPLIRIVADKISRRTNGDLKKRVDLLERGDIADIHNNISEMRKDIRIIRQDMGQLRDRVGRLEGIVQKNKVE